MLLSVLDALITSITLSCVSRLVVVAAEELERYAKGGRRTPCKRKTVLVARLSWLGPKLKIHQEFKADGPEEPGYPVIDEWRTILPPAGGGMGDALDSATAASIVLLNRAPSLHRLS